MIYTFLYAISLLISAYNILCIIRILLTWVPQLSYSKFAQFLARICDPYLNLFRGIKWLRMGAFDFSPALALCILGAAQSLISGLARGKTFTLGYILSMAIEIIWSIAQSLLIFLIILFIVRLIIIAINHGSWYTGNYMMEQVDRAISPLVFRISKSFSFGKSLTYKQGLIISLIVLIIVSVIGNIAFISLAKFLSMLNI